MSGASLSADFSVKTLPFSRIAADIQSVTAKAPTRIDLAGGTLDIYPLYLFYPETLTLNVAVNIYTYTTVKPSEGLIIELADLQRSYRASDVEELEGVPELALIVKSMKVLGFRSGFEVVTHSEAPLKSGLGASSSLLMTILAALSRYKLEKLALSTMVDLAANIEAQVLETLTGKQDYIAALQGGVNAIWFDIKGMAFEKITSPELIEALERHVLLAYSGFEHESGNLNWLVVKRFLDKDTELRELLSRIYWVSTEVYEALNECNMEDLGYYIKQEWNWRKRLSPEHTNHVIERFTEKIDPLAWGYKLCGAAGGGTMIIVADPRNHEEIKRIGNGFGFEFLDFKIDVSGLSVRTII